METNKGDGLSMKCHISYYYIAVIAFALILFPAVGPNLEGAPLFQDAAGGTESEEYEDEAAYEEAQKEYDAYMKASEEPDLLKRGDMLIEFIKTYPESDLIESYVKPTYIRLLSDCSENKNFEELEILSEKWLELYPDNTRAIAFAYNAAVQLGHDEKSLKYALKIYEIQPTAVLAEFVAQTYDKLGNFEKYVEWCEKVFTYPEFSVDYTLRFKIMSKYADAGNFPKAAEYAEQIIKVLKSAEKPDAAGQESLHTIQRICYHIIGINYFEKDKFKEAIKSFENALKFESYQEGFYYIARCYWGLNDPELAHDYFAAAELFGGDLTEKSKDYKEQLYKPLHNNSLIGIEKVMRRAQAIIDKYADPVASTSQKKTELSEVS